MEWDLSLFIVPAAGVFLWVYGNGFFDTEQERKLHLFKGLFYGSVWVIICLILYIIL